MLVMGRLNHQDKLTARTAPEVVDGVDTLLLRLKRAGFTFQSGPGSRRMKVGAEGLIGAVMLEFLALTPAGQDDVLRRRLPELERLLGVETKGPDGDGEVSQAIQVGPGPGAAAEPGKGRRRGAG